MQKEIVTLTSLRGIAAIAVIAMHFSATMQTIASGTFPSLAPHGELAVDVFFVLSGFIMAFTYYPSFTGMNGWTPYSNFLAKRAARILPLNITVSTIVVASALLTSWLIGTNLFPHVHLETAYTDLITNALMLPGLGIGQSINWPTWSISVEFAAYLLFPLFLFAIFDRRRLFWGATCGLAFLTLLVVCVTGKDLSPDGIHNHSLPWRDLGRCFSEFILGIAVFRLYRSGIAAALFRRDSLTVGILAAILVLVGINRGELFALLFFPPLILALSLNKGRIARFMAMRIPHFLGTISFSLYLVHDNFRALAVILVQHFHPTPVSPVVAMTLAALFTVSVILPAWASYVWIEKPGRMLVQKLGRSASFATRTLRGQ